MTTATPAQSEKMTGGKALVQALKSEGVDTVFGIISIHMLPIYDALLHEPTIRLIIPRHEMAGAFMADAYARTTGKVGVYLTSTGPGAANAMGAIIESRGASSRTLHITSQIQTYYHGKGMLHEVKDQLGMFNATGAHAVNVTKPDQIPSAVHKAFHNLRAHRPTPQVIEIPIDRQYAISEIAIGEPMPVELPQPSAAALDHAVDLLQAAKSPLIWVGGGVSNSGAFAELLKLADIMHAPVFMTRGGRGAIPDDHPCVIGNYFGERPARDRIQAADCVLALGTKFSWHSTNEWNIKLPKNLIRVDIDVEELQHNFPAAVAIHSDIKPALAGLTARLEVAQYKPSADLVNSTTDLKREVREDFRKHRPLTADLMDIIAESAPRDRIIATDATIPAYWGGNQYLPVYTERAFVTPRLAAIGPGYSMAIGAQAAFPDRPVVCISGDGGFMLHIGELASAVQEKLNVVCLIFNNHSYGILKKLQMNMMGGRIFAVDLHTPDFVKVAEGMGMAGEIATTPDQLKAALARAFSEKRPYLIDIQAPFEQ